MQRYIMYNITAADSKPQANSQWLMHECDLLVMRVAVYILTFFFRSAIALSSCLFKSLYDFAVAILYESYIPLYFAPALVT